MHQLLVSRILQALDACDLPYEANVTLDVHFSRLRGKGEELLSSAYDELGGKADFPLLRQLRLPVKMGKHLLVYDDGNHFNRYRLLTLKSEVYQVFNFSWHAAYLRLCRSHERECLLSGLQERVWAGPPIARSCFGSAESPGDLSGSGAPGWKLNAYNDLQYDLISRLEGYRLHRIPAYENLMMGGRLQRIDKLLLRPDDAVLRAIGTWLLRKMN
ncbi:hypothetical protein [Cyclobacterium xiamenense]|jgi:hypothetical protein|uniref:DUF7255 family protein n=1 Tax=Cyclobacterium xiamenense TaxID=1297121 RepID=UPI0035D042D0